MFSAGRSGVVNNGLGSVWDVQLCIEGAWTDWTQGKNRNCSEILLLYEAHWVIIWFIMCIAIYQKKPTMYIWK